MEENDLMQKEKMVAVIIPIYKQEPDINEIKSLKQCLKVLSTRTIIFICAPNLDCSNYQSVCYLNNITFKKHTFDKKYFRSKEDYNSLCLEKKFYDAFVEYEFILIYQLDAWVFSDELNYWCSQNYDYIGAPFPVDIEAKNEDVCFSVVGNGGFSLRRISAIINVFNHKFSRIKKWSQLFSAYEERISNNPLWFVYCIIRTIGYRNSISYLKKKNWEDHFFFDVARLTSLIRLPDPKMALKFSFEYKPTASFAINGYNLPMGCHGWQWIENEVFWTKFILLG